MKEITFAGVGQIGEESFGRRRGRDQLLDELPVRRQLLDQDERVERIPDVLFNVRGCKWSKFNYILRTCSLLFLTCTF
jgi:hypothetical protein